jgi:hypothetical protein
MGIPLTGKAVDDQGNRKADTNNVRDDCDDRTCDGFGPVEIRERHHNPVHDEVNRDAVQHA